MGLPISDTAMAIFRRWVRNLPLSSADRRHVHHLLIGMGMTPRQAAVLLYCFSAFLCGVVLLGVAFRNETLALVLGLSGCLAFLLMLTSRRNELATLRADFVARFARNRQERFAGKVTWEAIQRIELADSIDKIWEIVRNTTVSLGCDSLKVLYTHAGETVFERGDGPEGEPGAALLGPTASFRLSSGRDQLLTVALHQPMGATLEADIAFRFLQRLSLATAERLERLPVLVAAESRSGQHEIPQPLAVESVESAEPAGEAPIAGVPIRGAVGWVKVLLGWPAARATPQHSLGEK